MRFLSNFGRKIIFMCFDYFWHQQDSKSLFKEPALVTRPLSASGLSKVKTLLLQLRFQGLSYAVGLAVGKTNDGRFKSL